MNLIGVLFMLCAVLVLSVMLGHNSRIVSAVQAQRQAGSLCTKSEKIIFSCAVRPTGKIASLCASTDVTRERGYIQYRFGRSAKVELEYPASREQSQKRFRYSHYFRARVDLTEISFTSGDYNYTVFDSYNGEEKPVILEQGVTVTPVSGGKDISVTCRAKAKASFGDLGEILDQ
jgi:hypothetical protein